MNKLYTYILLLSLSVMMISGNVLAQGVKKKTTRIRVEYFRDYNKIESLIATLRIKEERYIPFTNAVVHFYLVNDTSSVELGKIKTDDYGEARFILDENLNLTKDSLGVLTFEVEYEGNKENKGHKRKASVKQANLEVSFFQKDTIKYIEVNANELVLDEQYIPIEDLEILFYIKGTFSLLNFAKEKTDENGNVKIEFPVYMPGDTAGVITIVVKVEENDDYGTIDSRGDINWAVAVPFAKEKQRGLGDTDAPLWMVYTLITLLSIVWFHYMYVIYLIVKIRLSKRAV
jgi:hypothetical protein